MRSRAIIHGDEAEGAWWKDEHERVGPAEDLTVVFGPTHFLDWLDAADVARSAPGDRREAAAERDLVALWREQGRARAALCSVSSWIRTEGAYADVTRATMLYADEDGPALLGWGWHGHRPFHIPEAFVRKRRLGQRLSDAEVKVAEQLRWPARLLAKWQEQEPEL